VILSLDADFAGDAAARRGIEIAGAAGLNIKIATVLAGKDPDECARQSPGLWKESVDKAAAFYDFVIASALNRFDKSEASGKAKIVTETAKFLTKIDNTVVKEHYVKKLADILGTTEEAVGTELDKATRRESLNLAVVPAVIPEIVSRQQTLEEYLLSLVLQSEKPLDEILLIKPRLEVADFSSAVGKIYEGLLGTEEPFATPKFISCLPTELQPLADRLYLADVSKILPDAQLLISEISKTVWEIKELALRAKLKNLSAQIKNSEDNGELNAKFDEASVELQKLLKDKKYLLGVGTSR
jgi:DNA primase